MVSSAWRIFFFALQVGQHCSEGNFSAVRAHLLRPLLDRLCCHRLPTLALPGEYQPAWQAFGFCLLCRNQQVWPIMERDGVAAIFPMAERGRGFPSEDRGHAAAPHEPDRNGHRAMNQLRNAQAAVGGDGILAGPKAVGNGQVDATQRAMDSLPQAVNDRL